MRVSFDQFSLSCHITLIIQNRGIDNFDDDGDYDGDDSDDDSDVENGERKRRVWIVLGTCESNYPVVPIPDICHFFDTNTISSSKI